MPKAIGDTKICSKCRTPGHVSNFQKNKTQADGLHNYCRSCVSASNRAWRQANPEKKRAQHQATRPGSHLSRYGLTRESYAEMLAQQGGCGICGSADPGMGRAYFAVDHDHRCCPQKMRSCGDCVRGLLCQSCNTGIGLLRDSVENLHAAIAYLSR